MLAAIRHVDDSLVFQQDSAQVHGACSTVQLLYSWAVASSCPELNAVDYKVVIQQCKYELQVYVIEEVDQQLVDFW